MRLSPEMLLAGKLFNEINCQSPPILVTWGEIFNKPTLPFKNIHGLRPSHSYISHDAWNDDICFVTDAYAAIDLRKNGLRLLARNYVNDWDDVYRIEG